MGFHQVPAAVAKENEVIVELEPPGVEKPIGEGSKKKVRFNLLPAGSSLMPKGDAGEEKAEADEQEVTD